MKTAPLFSLIIPVYNVERYLKQFLDSILVQFFSDFEIILANDGSADSNAELRDSYTNKNSKIIVVNKINGGYKFCKQM